jgi:hypothetical protein
MRGSSERAFDERASVGAASRRRRELARCQLAGFWFFFGFFHRDS